MPTRLQTLRAAFLSEFFSVIRHTFLSFDTCQPSTPWKTLEKPNRKKCKENSGESTCEGVEPNDLQVSLCSAGVFLPLYHPGGQNAAKANPYFTCLAYSVNNSTHSERTLLWHFLNSLLVKPSGTHRWHGPVQVWFSRKSAKSAFPSYTFSSVQNKSQQRTSCTTADIAGSTWYCAHLIITG